MSTHEVKVSGLAPTTSEAQLKDFFSFCGKVSSIKLNAEAGTASVDFEKAAAISTALLLSDSELNGSKVTITASADPASVQSAVAKENDGHVDERNDIPQEYKPKSTVLAEYLAQGYVLGDKAIASGLEIDKKHGISERFTAFLTGLDSRYHDTKKDLDDKYDLHNKTEALKERADATDKQLGITDHLQQGQATAQRYLDHALQTETGSKIRSFYSGLVQQVSDVHNEARRLADIKKEKEHTTSGGPSDGSAPAASVVTSAETVHSNDPKPSLI